MYRMLIVLLGVCLSGPVLAERYQADDGRSIQTGPEGMVLDDGAGNRVRIGPDGSVEAQGQEGRIDKSPGGEARPRQQGRKNKWRGGGNTQSRNIGCQIGADGVYRNCQQKQ